MSDTVYNVQTYLRFTFQEFMGIVVTSIFSAFVLTFNDWGDTTFSLSAGLWAFGLTLVFLVLLMVVTIWLCKVVAVRVGYQIAYKPFLFGLIIGMVLCVASRGYLPLFFPGGFAYNKPERLVIGKWRGYYKGWETGLIAASFPLGLLLWLTLLNPLYLLTGQEFYLKLILAVCLLAFYALLPLPNIILERHERALDWFQYLRGTTFGLELLYANFFWYGVVLGIVCAYAILSYVLTLLGMPVGVFLYIFVLLFTLLCGWVYKIFLKHH